MPRRRLWLMRLIAATMGITSLLIVEVMLRLVGTGRDLSLVIPVPSHAGWYQFNSHFDEPYYGKVDLSGPEPRPFQIPRPEGTIRILVIGGSTVVGFPYPSELAFPRHLQLALQAQCDETTTVEVLNAGLTAMNSSSEVAVVEEGLKAQPDAIVVYTGHNEFYGPGGVASSASWLSPVWFRTIARFRRLYLFQAIHRLTRSRAAPSDLLETLPRDVHIGWNEETFKKGATRFGENLDAMARLAGRAKVPILFVSPVANEHDQPPIENDSGSSNGQPSDWQKQLKLAEREMRWGDLGTAITQLEAARSERDQDPVVRFRLAQAYEQAGQLDDAREQFALALDLDGCRFRAPSSFRTIMAEIAQKHTASGATFFDLHQAICRDSESGVPGRKHFLEHVHFTWDGNRLVGNELAQFLWTNVWLKTWSPERVLNDGDTREQMGVQAEDHLAAFALAMTVYQKLPFRLGVDAEKLGKDLIDDSIATFRRFPPDRQSLFEERTQQEMSNDLLDHLLRAARARKLETLTDVWLKARMIRQPWRCDVASELVEWLRHHDENSEADRVQSQSRRWPCAR